MTCYERNANRLTIILFITLAGISIAGAIWLPSPTAIHYNLAGKPDRWGSPTTLLILPVIGFIVIAILWAADKAHPDFMNFPGPRTSENVSRQIKNIHLMSATTRAYITGMFLIFQAQSIWAKYYNQDRLVGWSLPILLIGLFVIIGYYVRQSYKLIPH